MGGGGPPAEGSPVGWLLLTLLASVGLPFFAVSTSGPLLQRWFSRTGHASARDPYFLYAASNAGSLIALLGFPFIVEPLVGVRGQSRGWTVGYMAFVALTAACAAAVLRGGRGAGAEVVEEPAEPAPWGRRGLWVLLAFVPSSLMLGATQYLSTDIAAVPLVWVLPLSLYLLSFIVAFSGKRLGGLGSLGALSLAAAVAIVGVTIAFLIRNEPERMPIWGMFTLHLVSLFIIATFCHARLAALRPAPSGLTEFFLFIAVGGVLGGIFNALVAPAVFTSVLEYPIVLVIAAFLRLPARGAAIARLRGGRGAAVDVAAAAAVFTLAIVLDRTTGGIERVPVRLGLAVGVPALVCYLISVRPAAFAGAIGGLCVLAFGINAGGSDLVAARRTFFGVYRVTRETVATEPPEVRTTLVHGTTLHGIESTRADLAHEPLSYYHREGPIGQVFAALGATPLFDDVGLIGLGSGSLAAYGRPGMTMTFHEIDPVVIELARSQFTYLRDSRARVRFAVGDGRLTMARAPDGAYGLIVLDAFTSDAIPVHLITREALGLYLQKLKPGGIIAYHVSNQYLKLAPIVGRLAESVGAAARVEVDDPSPAIVERTLHYGSEWVIVARRDEDFGPLRKNLRWKPLRPPAGTPLWTDEFSNIVRVLNW
jgi:SAM-dependent methyltransferase